LSYLLASGDSWSFANYKSVFDEDADTSFSKWPELIGQRLKLPVTNVSACGIGNTLIINNVFDHLLNNDPAIVIIALSSWDRIQMLNLHLNLYLSIVYEHKINPYKRSKELLDGLAGILRKHNEIIPKDFLDIITLKITTEALIDDNLRQIYLLQELCKARKIPLIIGQAFSPLSFPTIQSLIDVNPQALQDHRLASKKQFSMVMFDSKYYDMIEDKYTHGWPFFTSLGGFSFQDKWLNDRENGYHHYIISDADQHPNKIGQEDIANQLTKTIKKNYPEIQIDFPT